MLLLVVVGAAAGRGTTFTDEDGRVMVAGSKVVCVQVMIVGFIAEKLQTRRFNQAAQQRQSQSDDESVTDAAAHAARRCSKRTGR